MQYTSNYNLKKPEGTDVVNIDDLNDNADILDQKLKEVENKADNAPPNSVNDAAIGSRTPDQSQAPASPGTGTLTQLISWLANRIKTITGKTNWWDAPPTTLQAAKNHIDAAAPHSGHETPTGAQAKVDTHASSKQTHGISSGYYIAKTSRADQLVAWDDIQGKPDLASAAEVQAHLSDNVRHITASERTAWNKKLDASAYTAADVLAKVKTVDGGGSGLDADLLDGAHAGNGPNNVLKLDSGGFVPLPNIPGTLTGKSADMVDGKHFSDIQNDAQAKADTALNSAKAYTDQEVAEVSQALDVHKAAAAPHSGHETPAGAQAKANAAEANAKSYTDTHAGTKNTHGVGSGYYIAKTSRSDQLPAWNDVQGKPSNFTPSAHKSTHASGGSDALTPSDIGAETPAGAQAKVDNHAIQTATLSTLGHVKHAVLTATLTTASWTGTTSPYSQSVAVSGILATDTPIIDIVTSGTYSTDEARIEAWGYIYRAVTADGSITFYATEKPTVSLPIQIKVVR